MRYSCTVSTPIGVLTLIEEDGALVRLLFGEAAGQEAAVRTRLLCQAAQELHEYFSAERTAFSIPLRPEGTSFQHKCWKALQAIPYGETRTYAQQAQAVGNAKACRAVGMANHRNPLPILIPCHRVVGKNGTLTGYAGGLDIKAQLLQLEQQKGK